MYSNNKLIRDVADVAARIMSGQQPVTEKLHPNQQKLDVHEPEKDELTADDFKKLRAKKLKEDVTNATQRLKAALDRHVAHSIEASRNDDFEKRKVHQDYIHKIRNQLGKLAKNEEVEIDEEQLDELSKDTLASYEKKSRVAAHKHALASELKGLAADPAGSYAHKMMADKRHAGWKVAVKKLHTEESDTPFDGPYKQSKGTVTDKSGAKHTPLSNVRSLARNAIEKMKQKMRMAHLSPEVRAEKLARNEELVGGQKKLDIDKDGKIEKSDLEVLRAKKLKEDVTTAAQKLKAALDRHTEHAVAANRAGDHEAVKVHQEYANKIKTKLGKLAKNEEVEIDESENPFKNLPGKFTHILNKDVRGDHGIINMGTVLRHTGGDRYEVRAGKSKGKTVEIHKDHVNVNEEVEIDEGHQIVATTKAGETFKSGIHPTKEKALSQYYKMSKSGNYKKIATVKTEEVEIDEEQIEERNKQNAIMRKTMDASRGAKFKARNDTTTPDAEPQHKTAQAHNKAIGRAIRQMSNEEVEMAEGRMSQQHPLEGHPYHSKSDAELLHISKDAHAAAEAMKDHNTSAENKYRDQASDSATVRHFRKTHGTADWYKKKYALKEAAPVVISTKKPIGFRVSDVGPGGKESNVKTDKTWDDTQKEKKSTQIKEAEMTDAEMAKREKIVKGMKKSFKDFTAKYGDRAKEVMYATATKKAMEEEVEEELEEDMDEGVTTRNGAVTVHKGTYGTSYQPNDDEDDEDTPEKKEPAVKRGRGRPAGAKSGAKPKGSSAGKSYGGVAIHSLRLPNNNK